MAPSAGTTVGSAPIIHDAHGGIYSIPVARTVERPPIGYTRRSYAQSPCLERHAQGTALDRPDLDVEARLPVTT